MERKTEHQVRGGVELKSTKPRLTHQTQKSQGVRKRPLRYPQADPLQTILKDPNPRNHQGPRSLPLGSNSREGTPQRPWGLKPNPFPFSLDLISVWRRSGEMAKSSPLHNTSGALLFPIPFWCKTHATRKRRLPASPDTRKSLARPQTRGFGLQWPQHPPRADSSHLMNVAWTAGEKGGSTQLAPSTLDSRSCKLPHHSQP